MLSLPASKGFELGSGFAATRMRGSEHNDAFEVREGQVRTRTNFSSPVRPSVALAEMEVKVHQSIHVRLRVWRRPAFVTHSAKNIFRRNAIQLLH